MVNLSLFSQYVFEWRVEGKTIMSEINNHPKALSRVKVRMTAVTYLPFPGYIYKERNLHLANIKKDFYQYSSFLVGLLLLRN